MSGENIETESSSVMPKYQIRQKSVLRIVHSPTNKTLSLLNIKINPRREKWSMITVEYTDSLMCAHCFFITRLRVFEFLWVFPVPPRKPTKNWVFSPTPKPNPDWWYRFSFISCQKNSASEKQKFIVNVACGASDMSVPYGRPENLGRNSINLCTSSSKTLARQELNWNAVARLALQLRSANCWSPSNSVSVLHDERERCLSSAGET